MAVTFKKVDGAAARVADRRANAAVTFGRGERIEAAAIRDPQSGAFYYRIRPYRHGDVMHALVQNGTVDKVVPGDWEQGFVTTRLRFVDRKQAFTIAANAGQLKPIKKTVKGLTRTHKPKGPELYTEDLW
jgi:hypothetical protein